MTGSVGDRAVPQCALDLDQALADAFAQLGGGQPAERHEHELGQARDALRDVPGGQRRDRRRLARAGAGLQHDRALREGAAHVEGARSSGHLLVRDEVGPQGHRQGAEAGGLRAGGLLDEQPVERDRVAEREQVVVVDGLEPTTSRAPRPRRSRAPCGRWLSASASSPPPVRGWAYARLVASGRGSGPHMRLVVQRDEPVRGSRAGSRRGAVEPGDARRADLSAADRHRLERAVRERRGQREQLHPRAQAVLGARAGRRPCGPGRRRARR